MEVARPGTGRDPGRRRRRRRRSLNTLRRTSLKHAGKARQGKACRPPCAENLSCEQVTGCEPPCPLPLAPKASPQGPSGNPGRQETIL